MAAIELTTALNVTKTGILTALDAQNHLTRVATGSANWNSVYSNVRSLSTNWLNSYLPLSGGTLIDNPIITVPNTLSITLNSESVDNLKISDSPNGFDVVSYTNDTGEGKLVLKSCGDLVLDPGQFGSNNVVVDGTLSANNITGIDADKWDNIESVNSSVYQASGKWDSVFTHVNNTSGSKFTGTFYTLSSDNVTLATLQFTNGLLVSIT